MIAKIRDPKPAAHQNIQLIATEPKEPEPAVNIVTRSGASTSGTTQESGQNTSQGWCAELLLKQLHSTYRRIRRPFTKLRLPLMNLH